MSNILLTGESGVGKEVIAQLIHNMSKRADKPFIAVNCSSYSDTLLNSELFGHEQGAFTGAYKSRAGKFEIADQGTLFLDEIGDIDFTTQIKLLRTIENKTIERIGSNDLRKIDFRLISATNRDLSGDVASGRIREDFVYRISTIVIHIPALRERKEDLQSLIDFFIKNAELENDSPIRGIEPDVQDFLLNYDYPGNIRELKNIIDRMVVLSSDGMINQDGLPILYNLGVKKVGNNSPFQRIIPLREYRDQTEKEYLIWVMQQADGNVGDAARMLSLSKRQMYNKIRAYELNK